MERGMTGKKVVETMIRREAEKETIALTTEVSLIQYNMYSSSQHTA